MPKTLEAVTHDVLELPQSERLALAQIIFDLDEGPADPGAESAWDGEIRARLKAYDEGRMETIPYETLRAWALAGGDASAPFPERYRMNLTSTTSELPP